MLRSIKPKNARSKRALEKREPKLVENQKTALFLRGTTASAVVQDALGDLHALKKPNAVKFQKKNAVHPFEDAAPLEFFSEKNDTSLIVFGSHTKKRPNNLTFVRTFGYKVLDMVELLINPDTFKAMGEFKNSKCGIGLKPMLTFSGTIFDSDTHPQYKHVKSLFMDLFRGNAVPEIDVEALQYVISFSAAEPTDEIPLPAVNMRVYLLRTKKSGHKLPRVELEEMGPRMDFKIGRVQEADSDVMKLALAKSKALEPKTKKNIETDTMGDKMGRIHLGKQNLDTLQTRKMKGLKRRGNSDDEDEGDDSMVIDDVPARRSKKHKVK